MTLVIIGQLCSGTQGVKSGPSQTIKGSVLRNTVVLITWQQFIETVIERGYPGQAW